MRPPFEYPYESQRQVSGVGSMGLRGGRTVGAAKLTRRLLHDVQTELKAYQQNSAFSHFLFFASGLGKILIRFYKIHLYRGLPLRIMLTFPTH